MNDDSGQSGRSRELTLEAPAKVNLGLEVVRRRADGYHDLNTIFATVDLCDRVRLRIGGSGIRCSVSGNRQLAGEPVEQNLCVLGARRLLEECERSEGVEIVLEKRIPIGAGLGGGSSDAAAVLRGLVDLLSLPITDDHLHALALSLGSDVPFFLRGGVAHAEGRGERLVPLDVELPWSILLVNPGLHVGTVEAYRLVGRQGEKEGRDLVGGVMDALEHPDLLGGALPNDFEGPVFAAWPEIGRLHGRVAETDGLLHVGMSGSGSTIFGIYRSREEARRASRLFGEFFTHVGRLGRPLGMAAD